ncbi:hypothetical protein IE53DRAFT_262610 [Violaceomyces palustris]|uniref:Uncharacterized protein n=1 Tax=Violaceomyces palustris TaxID=1673888 RepID=A0ACD0NN15_9BASI|nr:hypothetical protein IE53DRAFT_262610 [Violaceomyces palustris]
MSILSSICVNFGRIATFVQVLFYLPLALDIAGQDAFLALSASLASYYFFLSTIRLLTRRTRLAWIGQTLAVFQFVVVPACLLVCFNIYSPPSTTYFPPRQSVLDHPSASSPSSPSLLSPSSTEQAPEPSADASSPPSLLPTSGPLSDLLATAVTLFFYLARHVPGWWFTFLRYSSPLFSLLEGVASLLVIQTIGSMSRWVIASSLSNSPQHGPSRSRLISLLLRPLASLGFGASEVFQIAFLLVSATVYVTSALALYVSFEGATRDRPGTAAAIATSVTSTLWLTAIAFALRKGNVIETSLMLAYVVFNIYQLGPSLAFTADPVSLIRSFKVNAHVVVTDSLPVSLQAPLPAMILKGAVTLLEVLANWLGQSLDFIAAAGAALPSSVIVSLVYRLMVLYAASRILPMLKSRPLPDVQEWSARDWSSEGTAAEDEDWEEEVSSSVSADWDAADGKGLAEDSDEYSEGDSGIAYNVEASPKEGATTRRKASAKKDPLATSERSTAAIGGAVRRGGRKTKRSNAKSSGGRKPSTRLPPPPPPTPSKEKESGAEKDGKSLSEEEPFSAFISIIVSYSRLILIAVYSHLLLLDQSHQIYWRFLTVGITLVLWGFELLIGKEDVDVITR